MIVAKPSIKEMPQKVCGGGREEEIGLRGEIWRWLQKAKGRIRGFLHRGS